MEPQRRNISCIYWLNFAWSFLLLQPVIVPFFQSRGLAMSEIFTIQTVFSVTLCFLDVPTGYLCDFVGRRVTLLAASALKGTGGILLCMANGWLQLAGAYVVIGLANSLFSGADVALLYESLETIPEVVRPPVTTLFGRRTFAALAGAGFSALLGGFLAGTTSLNITVVANAICAWIPFAICLFLTEVPRTQVVAKTHFQNVGRLARELVTQSRYVRLIIGATVLYTAAPVLSVYVFQGFWGKAGIPMTAFGTLTAVFSIMGALAGQGAHRIEKRLGTAGIMALICLLPVVGFLGAAVLPLMLAIASGVILELERGLCQSMLARQFNTLISSHLRATANSLVSFGSRVFVALSGPVLGWTYDHLGATACLSSLGLVYLVAFLLIGIPLIVESKKNVGC